MEYQVKPTSLSQDVNYSVNNNSENKIVNENVVINDEKVRIPIEDLPPTELKSFLPKSLAIMLSCFIGTKSVGVENKRFRRKYVIAITFVGILQVLTYIPLIYSWGFSWTQTLIIAIFPIANYPITTQDECRIFESPLLTTALKREENLKQFDSIAVNLFTAVVSAFVQLGLPFIFCVIPYFTGTQIPTSDTDITTYIIMAYVGMISILVTIIFQICIPSFLKLLEIHFSELKIFTTEYVRKVFVILINETIDSKETMDRLGKLHRSEKFFIEKEIKLRSKLISTSFLFTVPMMISGLLICFLEPLNKKRAASVNVAVVIMKYLVAFVWLTYSVLVAYTYVGDASKIHRIYKEEIEDKFKNPELLNVVVHQKFGGSFLMFQSWMQSNRLFLSIYGKPVDATLASEIIGAFTSVMSIAVIIFARSQGLY